MQQKIFLYKKIVTDKKNIFYAENGLGVISGSIIMNHFRTDNTPKNPIIYNCVQCNFNTSNKKDFNRHLTTAKHIKLANSNDFEPFLPKKPQTIICSVCQKEYVSKSGLWYHMKKCNNNVVNEELPQTPPKSDDMMTMFMEFVREKSQDKSDQNSLILELVKQNTEFKELLIDQNKQMMELAKNTGNNNNNTNSHNKFNLNVFLNETCKDAITMKDFINSIEVTLDDFISTGNIGFVNGISKVMVERIKDMDLHTRPLHCTDLKRETVYIKNDEKWEKEDEDKSMLRKAVKTIAKKNYNQLQKWYNNSKPSVDTLGSEECENYFKYYKASLGGYDKEEDSKFEDKIIKNVLKEVIIDRQ
jgi:hypothetical protein